ncbi:unnamed protein product [Durusdinium trenchii]|uniref:Metallophosphoesterase domain-containing protein 1 n=2 Tax=Durusdinium trenchii TaxID=1381693 RepID=A0ABP0PN37_9DINO
MFTFPGTARIHWHGNASPWNSHEFTWKWSSPPVCSGFHGFPRGHAIHFHVSSRECIFSFLLPGQQIQQDQFSSASWCPAGAHVVPPPWREERKEGWTRFVCFSDTHNLHGMIPQEHMPPGDVLLHAGDFTDSGELEQVESFNQWLERYPAEVKVVIAGNHDVTFDEDYYLARGARRFHKGKPYDCSKARGLLKSCTYLEDSSIEVRGYKIFGSPWQPDFFDWAFNRPRGHELRKKWEAIPEDTDILLVHGPPAGHVDMTSHEGHAGCEELLAAVQARAIAAVVAGHLHTGYGTSADEVTLFVNASTCTSDYNPTRPPIVFDLPPSHELRAATNAAARARGGS